MLEQYFRTCHRCEGKGTLPLQVLDPSVVKVCPTCEGHGVDEGPRRKYQLKKSIARVLTIWSWPNPDDRKKLYRQLYKEFEVRNDVNINALRQRWNISGLEVAYRLDMLEDLYHVATSVFPPSSSVPPSYIEEHMSFWNQHRKAS